MSASDYSLHDCDDSMSASDNLLRDADDSMSASDYSMYGCDSLMLPCDYPLHAADLAMSAAYSWESLKGGEPRNGGPFAPGENFSVRANKQIGCLFTDSVKNKNPSK